MQAKSIVEAKDTRILVADDVAVMRDLLKSVLRNLGYLNIVEASNGELALKEFEGMERPRIAFLDIEMPKRSGLEVLREIRREYPRTFVVIVSAAGTLENLQEAIAHGADAFVVKPYKGAKIQEALAKLASQQPGGRATNGR